MRLCMWASADDDGNALDLDDDDVADDDGDDDDDDDDVDAVIACSC